MVARDLAFARVPEVDQTVEENTLMLEWPRLSCRKGNALG